MISGNLQVFFLLFPRHQRSGADCFVHVCHIFKSFNFLITFQQWVLELTFFGNCHCRGHLCFTNTFFFKIQKSPIRYDVFSVLSYTTLSTRTCFQREGLFIWGFTPHSRFFLSFGNLTIAGGVITTCFYFLSLSRLGFEHPTFRLRCENSSSLRHHRGSEVKNTYLVHM